MPPPEWCQRHFRMQSYFMHSVIKRRIRKESNIFFFCPHSLYQINKSSLVVMFETKSTKSGRSFIKACMAIEDNKETLFECYVNHMMHLWSKELRKLQIIEAYLVWRTLWSAKWIWKQCYHQIPRLVLRMFNFQEIWGVSLQNMPYIWNDISIYYLLFCMTRYEEFLQCLL